MNGVRESLTQTLGCSPHQDWAMEFASEVKALGTTVRERAPEDVAAGGLGDSFALNLNTYYPLMRVSAVRLQSGSRTNALARNPISSDIRCTPRRS